MSGKTSQYDQIYSRDAPDDGPHGWIQWKGTDACIDLHCACGAIMHYDGDFFYFYACGECGARYAVGAIVKLIPLTPEQAAWAELERGGFRGGDDIHGEGD